MTRRPRDIVQNFTIIEVTEGKYEGMRGWLKKLDTDSLDVDDPSEPCALVMLVGRNEAIFALLPLRLIRPADPQTIGTGEA